MSKICSAAAYLQLAEQLHTVVSILCYLNQSNYVFWIRNLIPYRYPSCSYCWCCRGKPLQFKKLKAPSFQIGPGWNLAGLFSLHVNTHRLTESDFWVDVILSRWRPWRRSFRSEKCCHRNRHCH